MKKMLIIFICLMLILSMSACGGKGTDNPTTSIEDSKDHTGFDDEDFEDSYEDYEDTNSPKLSDLNTSNFTNFSDAETEFNNHISQNSSKVEAVYLYQNAVSITDMTVLDNTMPLYIWGETLDNEELEMQDISTSIFVGEDRSYRKYDLERESETRYRVIKETHDGEVIITEIEYYPDLDAVRLETVSNGKLELVFEYAKTKDGYAAQYYFETIIGGSYGAPQRGMCAYKIIFSGLNGSKARFIDVEEPASIIGNVPDAEDFIKGANDWLTIKDGNFTGELAGESF